MTHITRISCNTSSDSEHIIYTTTIGQIILYLISWFSFSELDGSTVIEYLISTAQASMGILLSLTTARQIHNIRPLAVVWDERCPLNSSIDLGGLRWVIQRWYCHELTHIIRELSNFSASGIAATICVAGCNKHQLPSYCLQFQYLNTNLGSILDY